ncbi:MAG: hypothetical protein LBF93_10925 [Zoogloeaceae bacterium]|jgi:uncharacterized protein|nr:hypothetical protein [Zoogloeaceae bacterium]
MKYLFVLILCWIAWRLLRPALRKPPPSRAPPSREHDGERMIACAHCGIYAPEREMLRAKNGRCYCSPEHRAAAAEGA